MKKIFLIIILSLELYTKEITGMLNAELVNTELINDNVHRNVLLNYYSLQLNIDKNLNDLHIQITPYIYFFKQTNKSSLPLKSVNMSKPFKKEDIFLRSAYISYKINKKTLIGLGILPFTNSNFSQYNKDYTKDGVGLNTINDSNMLSLFTKYYYTNNSNILFGYGYHNKKIPLGTYIRDDLRNGTKTLFAINTNNYNKFTIINEVLYNDIKYDNKYPLSKQYLYAVGISYDDSDNSGYSIYDTIGFSIYKNNNIKAKNSILKHVNMPIYLLKEKHKQFAFNNKRYYGASNLVGIRKDFDIFRKDFFINIEWFRTFNNWNSCVLGTPYNNSYSTMFNIRDNAYTIRGGFVPKKNWTIILKYNYLEYKRTGKIGANMVTIPSNESIVPNFNLLKLIDLKINYKF